MLSLSDIVNVKVGIGKGVFEAPGATIIGGAKLSFETVMKKLFSNGEQGFFYDPNDLSTMFQDAVGTVPVTFINQPVGLLMDKSKGLVLGSNQVSYPNSKELPATVNMGDSAGTWGLNTNAPISGTQDSRLIVTSTSSNDSRPSLGFRCSSPLVPDKLYKFSFRYKVNSGEPRVRQVHNGSSTASIPSDKGVLQGTGTFDVFILWATGELAIPVVYFSNKSVFDLQIDDISVREVKGNHAYQTTSAMRPLLVANPQRLNYDAVDDNLITTLPAQLTDCTVIRSVPNVGTQIMTGQTIPATYEDNTDHCGLLVINRALTPSETSTITAEFNKRAGV